MEAMAVGVPVIATDIPGSREMISHKQNGWLVAPADSSSLANAITELIENPQLRQQLSQAGKQSVKQYSIQEIAKSYKNLYDSLLAGFGKND
jgi:glycosyltransferase involved in cell wall biosynthesis